MIHKTLIIVFGLWILQGILSYMQINHYRKTLNHLKTKGKVYIGQDRGKLRPGSIVLLVSDDNNVIIDMQEMKGISVFDKFKRKEKYIGKSLNELIVELSQLDKENNTIRAIKSALNDFPLT